MVQQPASSFTRPPRFRYEVHIAGKNRDSTGSQLCRRCEVTRLTYASLTGPWHDGDFVLETMVWNENIREGVGYQRMALSPISEAEVMADDKVNFCFSVVEAIRHVEYYAALGQSRENRKL